MYNILSIGRASLFVMPCFNPKAMTKHFNIIQLYIILKSIGIGFSCIILHQSYVKFGINLWGLM